MLGKGDADARRHRQVQAAAFSLLGTRVPVLAIGALAVWLVGTWPPPTSEALWRVSGNEMRNLLARWDTAWYYSIATAGYHWDPSRFQHENVVFFPLYPLLMRWGGQVLGTGPLAAGLIVFARRILMPRLAGRAVATVAAASFYIYLFNAFPIYLTDTVLHSRFGRFWWLQIVASLGLGIAAFMAFAYFEKLRAGAPRWTRSTGRRMALAAMAKRPH